MKFISVILGILLTYNMVSQTPNWILFDQNNSPIVNDSITWVEVDTNNVKWIGTRNGLYSFDNNTWTVYNTSNSNIPNNRIDKFKIAYDNTIWFVNNNNGFYKLNNNIFTLYNQGNLPALFTDSLVGLTIDSNDVFFWSDNKGVVKYSTLSNTVTNINTSNSYLRKIERLVAHGNHMIYGLSKEAIPNNLLTFNDSVSGLHDFRISNTPSMTISYFYNNLFYYGNYFHVIADRFGNRYEIVKLYTGSQAVDQRLRWYDQNNTLLSDISYNQTPSLQIAQSLHGLYSLDMTSFINTINVTIFSPAFSNTYNPWNSIIPNDNAINFDIDTLNNLWLATPMGLAAYNEIGVITTVEKQTLNNYKFYPNPAQNELTIKCENYDNVKINIQFIDVFGKVIAKMPLNITINNEAKIDVSNLPNGIYYLETNTEQKKLKDKKVVIKK